MNFAVIETGGKQYLVKTGSKIKIENIPGEINSTVYFNEVLLLVSGNSLRIGHPYLSDKVEGIIVNKGRHDKKIVFKYSSKSRYRKKKGHRQQFAEIKITKI